MSYFLAPSLARLRAEVDDAFPRRDKTSDGWIGDASHQARPSSHNPDWQARGRRYGIVRGLDVDVDDRHDSRDVRRELLNACVGDPRVWYVISNGIIYSVTHDWRALRYTGPNQHFSHVHVSLRETEAAEFSTASWLSDPLPKIRRRPVSISEVRDQFLRAVNGRRTTFSNDVGRVQQVLNRQYGKRLVVDGLAGKATLDAWGDVERRHLGGVVGRPRVPDAETFPRFARGRFSVAS